VEAGDTREAVGSRAALERAGVGEALVGAVRRVMVEWSLPDAAVVVDLGAGTGYALAAVSSASVVTAVVLDGCADLVLSLHARRNPADVARVLKPEGRLLVAVPAPDDLVELRAFVQGARVTRDRVGAMVAEHEGQFAPERTFRVADERRLEPGLLRALLGATYRGARTSVGPRVATLGTLTVTLASDVCVFRPRRGVGARPQHTVRD
jgi:23S rRNA (guanine745-N1)-methyltransferase